MQRSSALGLLVLSAAVSSAEIRGLRADSPVSSGLVLHLDGSDLDGARNGPTGDPGDGASVREWADVSGEGHHLLSDGARPIRVDDGVGGRPAVEFGAGDDVLERADILGGVAGNPALDLFVVIDSSELAPFFGLGTGVGGQTKITSTESAFHFANGARHFAGSPLYGAGPRIGNFVAPESPTYGTHRFVLNGDEATASKTTTPNGWTLFPASGGVTRLGAGIGTDGAIDGDFSGRIAEVLAFSRELTSTERTLVLNYLSSRYGIAVAAALDLYAGDIPANGGYSEDVFGIAFDLSSRVPTGGAAGLRIVDRAFLVDPGDSLLAGHTEPTNGWIAAEVGDEPRVATRAKRSWFLDARDAGGAGGTVDLAFDFAAASLGSPSLSDDYFLVGRNTADWTVLASTPEVTDGVVTFGDVEVAELDGRVVTLGNSSSTPRVFTVVISEFLASNRLTVDDFQGDSSDFVELRNTSPTNDVDVGGWYLTDNPRLLRKWRIPDETTIDAEDELLIFASGKDLTARQLHTNFELNTSGEFLALVAPDETIVDQFAPRYPRQFRDVAYGLPSPTGDATYLERATPGRSNAGPTLLGPEIDDESFSPPQPGPSDDIVVTAIARDVLAPVAALRLTYRVLYGAEAAPISMNDAGRDGDAAAGDGVFTGVIPSGQFQAGDMVRWIIEAEDTDGNVSASPRFTDPRRTPEYHGTVVSDPARDSSLPVFDWFLRPGTESAADTRTGTRASVAFLGEFYDNVFVRIRGGSTSGLRKKSYKFDFNPGYHFRVSPGTQDECPRSSTSTPRMERQGIRSAAVLSYETIRQQLASPACRMQNLILMQQRRARSIALVTAFIGADR